MGGEEVGGLGIKGEGGTGRPARLWGKGGAERGNRPKAGEALPL